MENLKINYVCLALSILCLLSVSYTHLLSKCELNATKIIKIIGIINLFPNFVTLIVEQKPLIKMKDLTLSLIHIFSRFLPAIQGIYRQIV